MAEFKTEWNPRYVAYARAFGSLPEDMLAKHTDADGVVNMSEFMAWIQVQWQEFERTHKPLRIGRTSAHDVYLWRQMNMDAFDIWLQAGYDPLPIERDRK